MDAIFHVLFEIELINLILFFIGDSFRIDWLGKWGDPNSRALIGCREKLLCITIFHQKKCIKEADPWMRGWGGICGGSEA